MSTLQSIQGASILEIWSLLKLVSTVRFIARSENGSTGWNGKGVGKVSVSNPSQNTIIFSESGSWTTHSGARLSFSNRYRWTKLTHKNILQLEHLRYGNENPIKLLELYPASENHWKTVQPYICIKDLYSLELSYTDSAISTIWEVLGPGKNERIENHYN